MLEWLYQVDNTVFLWVQSLRNPVFDVLMPFLSFLGNYGLIWLIAAVLLLCRKQYRRYGVLLLVALAVGYILGDLVIKNLVERMRPFEALGLTPLVPPPESFSFPSGHALSSFASAAVLLYADRRLGTVGFLLAVCIAVSRVYVCVHYPTDVVAGAVIGSAVGCLTVFAGRWIWNNKRIFGKKS